MGTDTNAPANAVATPPKWPAESYSNENLGIVAELRVISYLMNAAFDLGEDLDALRQQFTPFKL